MYGQRCDSSELETGKWHGLSDQEEVNALS